MMRSVLAPLTGWVGHRGISVDILVGGDGDGGGCRGTGSPGNLEFALMICA